MLTTRYLPGAPDWLELGTPDVPAATDFYAGLFGWTLLSAGPDAQGYGFFELDGKTVAAVGPLTGEGARSTWTVYFHTPDADLTMKSVEQARGTVRFEPFDVFARGRMGGFTDPGGAEFAIWQPGGIKGLDAVTDPGCLCWAELYAPDPDAARSFYHAVFSWDSLVVPFAGGDYIVLTTAGGGQDASFGGIMPLPPGGTPRWLPYIEVLDCDGVVGRAEQLGGTVELPATTAEGIGRFARLTDPFGAHFAVITSRPS